MQYNFRFGYTKALTHFNIFVFFPAVEFLVQHLDAAFKSTISFFPPALVFKQYKILIDEVCGT